MPVLALHETSAIVVDPRSLYFPSGIEVQPLMRYRFTASGKWQDGWFPACGPEGWHGLFLQAWNRLPWSPFFLLCGTVGQDLEHVFAVGKTLDWTAPPDIAGRPDRQLYFFANDWPSKYGNNYPVPEDPLTVNVTRLV